MNGKWGPPSQGLLYFTLKHPQTSLMTIILSFLSGSCLTNTFEGDSLEALSRPSTFIDRFLLTKNARGPPTPKIKGSSAPHIVGLFLHWRNDLLIPHQQWDLERKTSNAQNCKPPAAAVHHSNFCLVNMMSLKVGDVHHLSGVSPSL